MLYKNLICSLFFLAGCAAYAQTPFGFGVKGGWALTNSYSLTPSSGKDYIVGPFAELRLPFGLGVEGDALFHPTSLTSLTSSHATWEFPILAKYHFGVPAPFVKPFVEAGPGFRAHSGDLPNLTSKGFVIGGGVQFKMLIIRASAEARYTRWSAGSNTGSAFPNVNQAELLFGIGF